MFSADYKIAISLNRNTLERRHVTMANMMKFRNHTRLNNKPVRRTGEMSVIMTLD